METESTYHFQAGAGDLLTGLPAAKALQDAGASQQKSSAAVADRHLHIPLGWGNVLPPQGQL